MKNKFLKLLIKRFIFNMEYIFSNFYVWFIFAGFLFLGLLLPTIFFPFFVIGGVQVIFSISIPLLVVLGGVSYNWKKSTLMNNEILTKSNKFVYWLSIILVIFVIGNIQQFCMELINYLSSLAGILLNNWSFLGDDYINSLNYNNVNAINYIYAIEINLVIVFSIFFMTGRFFSNIKNYYIFISVLMIFSFIFGGGLSEMFTLYELNNPINPSSTNFFLTYPKFYPPLFPKQMFLPTLLISPFFSSSTFYTHTISWSIAGHSTSTYTKTILPFLLTFTKDNWQWSLTMIMPYIWLVTSLITGVLNSKLPKNK